MKFCIRIIIFFCIFSFSLSAFAERNFTVKSLGKQQNTDSRKRMIEYVLTTKPLQFHYDALEIIIDTSQREPRGRFQGKKITLSAFIRSDSEFLKLLIHEIGHYVDIYIFHQKPHTPDLSDEFYSISWLDTNTKKPEETLSSFVSGYAATNKYEDFAESFTFYIFHNEEFSARAIANESLRKKYLFFRERVFPSGVFVGTDFRTNIIPDYIWDTTKVPISLKKYLHSLSQFL